MGDAAPRHRPPAVRLDTGAYFDIIRNMEAIAARLDATTPAAVRSLAALAHASRLAAFRLLVEAGPEGLQAGVLALRLGLPAATLSFHVKELAQAGLVSALSRGRFVIYSANFPAINELIGYLTENCCQGRGRLVDTNACATACAPERCTPSKPRTRASQ